MTKPFCDQDPLDAVRRGLQQDRTRRERQGSADEVLARVGFLTAREQEVIAGVGLIRQAGRGKERTAYLTGPL